MVKQAYYIWNIINMRDRRNQQILGQHSTHVASTGLRPGAIDSDAPFSSRVYG